MKRGMIGNIHFNSPIGKSDHCVIEFDYNCSVQRTGNKYRKFLYDKGNYDEMRKELNIINWKQILEHCEVNEQWKIFCRYLKDVANKYIPSRIYSRDPQGTYIDNQTAAAIRKKHRCWQRYMEAKTKKEKENRRKEYARQRNKVRKITRKLQNAKENNIVSEVKNNPKKFWRYIKSMQKTSTGIADLVISEEENQEKLTQNDNEKAEVLSNFFTSVFTQEPNDNIPNIEKQAVKNVLSDITITAKEVEEKLKKLKIDKSPGPDEMHPRLLKEMSYEIAEAVSVMFNSTISKGKVPDDWKTANITAIFKKGKRKLPNNYRPVSLTCILCKILEELIRDKIMKHMKENKLFSNKQFGFISGRSTTTVCMGF